MCLPRKVFLFRSQVAVYFDRQHFFYYHPRQVITLYRLGKAKKKAALQKKDKKTRRKMLKNALITLKEVCIIGACIHTPCHAEAFPLQAHDALSVALGTNHPFSQDALMQINSIQKYPI